MVPRLIALYSPVMGSGKSTIARHLVQEHGYAPLSFATPLKQMVFNVLCPVYGLEKADRMVWGDLKETTLPEFGGKTPRYLMQTLGTEWGRDLISKNLWVDLALYHFKANPNLKFVIDDMRFENEYEAAKEAGASLWGVKRPGLESTNGHSSEGNLNNKHFDILITNGQTVEMLLTAVDMIMDALEG